MKLTSCEYVSSVSGKNRVLKSAKRFIKFSVWKESCFKISQEVHYVCLPGYLKYNGPPKGITFVLTKNRGRRTKGLIGLLQKEKPKHHRSGFKFCKL